MSRLFRQFVKSLAPLFQPPFEGLWLLIVLYYGWCFFVYPNSQILRGNFPDPDDYMYLTQTLDWLQGQGWYDNIQHRMNPPADGSLGGTPIHFSRFAQIPMAMFVLLFELVGLPPRGAASLMALLYPLLLLAGFLGAMKSLVANFVPKEWAGISAYIALFSTGMMFMFMPGHVDHHGLIIMLMTGMLALIMRMMDKPGDARWGLYAGLVMAFTLTIALEVLPWLLLISGFIGIWAVVKGGKAARNALVYALALYLGSVVLLALTRPPGEWFMPDVLTYSIVYVLLTGGVAVGFAGVAAMASARPAWRWAVGGGLAALTGYLFLHRFPELAAGPYGGMDPELARMMLGELGEAKPLVGAETSFLGLAIHLGGFVVAYAAGVYFIQRAKGENLWRWALIMLLLTAAFLLTTFYQERFLGMMGMLTIIPLTVFLQRGWPAINKTLKGRRKVLAEIGLLLLVGPLPGVLFPAMVDGRSFNKGVLLFPVDADIARTPCDTYVLEKILSDPVLYGNRPRLIVSSIGEGPELLFRTQHKVLSAPYHMDVTGNIDATRFFSTPYEGEAEAIARRRHIDLIAACRYVPDIYTRPLVETPGTHGVGRDFAPHFIELLMAGKTPKWLKRQDFRGLSNFVIYEVRLPGSDTKKSESRSE